METQDDVFSDSRPIIVDCDLLEAAKENVQPLASGRRVTALSAILATPHAQRESKLSATRNRLRINVELALDDEEGDPLEAYCRLVYWTVENYPQGPSVESGLIELLEEATRVLKDDREGHWRGDLKYLKLWLLYASFVEKPTIIYRFLIANEIGTDHALLYEEFAAVLERDGRRKDADDTYVLGIARRASPIEHLQSRYSDFQKRMMSSSLPVSPAQSTVPARPALAAAPLTSRSGSSSRTAAHRSDAPLASSATHTRPTPTSNRPLQIFVDPTGTESQAAEASANSWTDIGTRKTRIKENVPEVKKLVGTTLKQAGRTKRLASGSASGASSGPSNSKIVPYRDPSPSDMPPPPAPASKKTQDVVPRTPAKSLITPFVDGQAGVASEGAPTTPRFMPFRDEAMTPLAGAATPAPESVMKVKKDGMKAPVLASEAEALRKDPLKNYPEAGIDEND
ncbi:Mad3/BUB1 homology region 1-domain-containing protein [Collybia nuda]|uniref:Mad3/BUB1 homology region 1-domain-containing protein n=1 Tax=Collybia nuda TaxID=64659 RepID=A0A9P5XXR0_9AGAR|nr:Mad3/BUB1 homology region 1-domain-containing protein [Collybia nuda]